MLGICFTQEKNKWSIPKDFQLVFKKLVMGFSFT